MRLRPRYGSLAIWRYYKNMPEAVRRRINMAMFVNSGFMAIVLVVVIPVTASRWLDLALYWLALRLFHPAWFFSGLGLAINLLPGLVGQQDQRLAKEHELFELINKGGQHPQ